MEEPVCRWLPESFQVETAGFKIQNPGLLMAELKPCSVQDNGVFASSKAADASQPVTVVRLALLAGVTEVAQDDDAQSDVSDF